ncbi:DNA-binding response regulator [Gammaproteobacteria bacterium 45_16_T64]|nr:DNA-binding response regulator [Gammaproteobacteria bacterium 45_16_T64]
MRLLVVEDELAIQEQLKQALEKAGYSVDIASDGEEALYLGVEHPYDLALVDLGLPKINGVDVIRRLRAQHCNYPVLILTARGNWQDKVEGLEAGGDDYVVKPFHMEEVLARINALLRRAVGLATSTVAFGAVELDTSAQQLTLEGVALELTSYEYKVIEYLMLHPNEVVSKTTLTEHIYDQDYDRDSNVIEVFIGRLRKKIDPGNTLKPIETLRGRGYRFTLARTNT